MKNLNRYQLISTDLKNTHSGIIAYAKQVRERKSSQIFKGIMGMKTIYYGYKK